MATRIKRKVNKQEALFCNKFVGIKVEQIVVTLPNGAIGRKEENQDLDMFIAYLIRSEIPFRFTPSRLNGKINLVFALGESEGRISFLSNTTSDKLNANLAVLNLVA